ncbi:hypothetical protein LTR73_008681 [Friedmanniomyces endolithicus]|nr:hypothetical protein LTR73_008681 [Friedmanniomyces endolithicus]
MAAIQLDSKSVSQLSHLQGRSSSSLLKANDILNINHRKNHIIFIHESIDGVFMHNNIAHHTLTILALGGTPRDLESHFQANSAYQRAQPSDAAGNVTELDDLKSWETAFGHEENYGIFLHFFEAQLESKPIEEVLDSYLFSDTYIARRIMVRMFMGFVHPFIHLGLVVEFQQSAIVAEALAQACIHHDDYLFPFFHDAEEGSGNDHHRGSLMVELLAEARCEQKIKNSTSFSTFERLEDGVLQNARLEITRIASRWSVESGDVNRVATELLNASVFLVAGAQRPPHPVRFDFFLMHSLNAAMFLSALIALPRIGNEAKARLLESFGRYMILLYAAEGSPCLDMTPVNQQSPLGAGGWKDTVARITTYCDDGHASKMIRALAHAEKVCEAYEGQPGFAVSGQGYLKAAEAIVKSLNWEGAGPAGPGRTEPWVRGAGFADAWNGGLFPYKDPSGRAATNK